jgi:hypothetical protein
MTLAEDNDVLEELSTAGTEPAFRDGVLPWTAVGDPKRLGAHGLDELDHGGAEYRVAVEDEDSRRRYIARIARAPRETRKMRTRSIAAQFGVIPP